MISTPPSVVPAISAGASFSVSSRLRILRWLVEFSFVLAVLLGGAGSTASAQTAHFSGAQSQSTVASGFNTPAGVALDSAGNLYVADATNNVVREILAVNGSIPASPIMVTLGSGFKSPIALALDGSGNVYVADYGNYAVKEILAVNGSIPASPTIRTLTTVQLPSGIAVDSNGNVFVSVGCVTGSMGMMSNSASAPTGSCGPLEELLAVNGSVPASPVVIPFSGFTNPAGLAFDTNGNLYVADQASNSVKEILAVNGSVSISSTIRTVASFTGSTGPTSVAIDSSGNAYVAYPSNNAVYEVLAVNGSIPASPAIVSVGSGFKSPLGVAVDKSGTVYVADALNNRVVKMSLSIADFGAVNIGTTSAAIPMFFTFDSAGALGSMAVLTQGATGLDFANVGTGSCRANTAFTAGQSCTVIVTFTPKFAGKRIGTAVLYDTAGNVIATGSVQGVGVGPQISFYPSTASTVAAITNPQGLAIDNSGNVFVSNVSGIYQMQAVNGSVPVSPSVRTITATGDSYYSVAVDAGGNLYTAGYPGNSVIEIEAIDGTIPASPSIVTLTNSFNNPQYIAVDRIGNVYVADSVNSAVKEILAVNGSIPDSPTIITLATEPGCIIGPLALDSNGNVFFSCGQSLMEIVAVNGSIPASPIVRTLATNGGYSGIAIDASGNVYVLNASSGTVQEILAVNGSVSASPYIFPLGEGFIGAEGLAVDARGNVYIADALNNRVVKLNPSTPPTLTFAPATIGTTSFDSPRIVIISNAGNALLSFPIPSTGANPSIGVNFALSNSTTCPPLSPGSYQPGFLPPGASCLMPISFVPTATGTLSSSLVLTDNNLNAAAPGYATQSIALSGTGVNPPPTFTINAPDVTLIQGGTSQSVVTVTVINPGGLLQGVRLAVQGLPGGVTGSISPNPTSGTSVLTLTAHGIVSAGIYRVTIMILNMPPGSLGGTTSFALTVIAAPGFTLSASPASLTIPQGGSGASTITVLGDTGFTGGVDLYDDELPGGVMASYLPSPTTGTSLLTFTVSSDAPIGTYNASIVGIQSPWLPPVHLMIPLTIVPLPGFAPSSANLGTINIGTASTVLTLTYNFGANVTLGSTTVLTQGAAGLDFTDAGTGTCAANTAYTLGQSCTMNVTFTPKFAGNRYGAAVLNDNNGNPIATAYLQGLGVGPQVNFLPGTETTVASSGLNNPYGVAVDGSGSVYIADTVNNRILKETLSGGSYTESTISTSSLYDPYALAVDASGSVYIADTNNYRVLKETPSATGYSESVVFDFTSSGVLPNGIAVDGSGNVYISHIFGTVYVETRTASGYTQSTIETGSSSIATIAVDSSGNIYVADVENGRVLVETPAAGGYTQSTLPTSGIGQPWGIATDANNNLYITDLGTNTVFKETLAGNSYTQSAISTSALNQSFGIAVDASGNVYIADTGNYRILKENFADAPSLTFASTAVGSTGLDGPQTITIENVGNAVLNLPISSTGNNPNITSNFTFDSSGDSACPLVSSNSSTAGALAAGASCQLPVSFTPIAIGALSGSLTVMDNNLNAAAPGYAAQSIALRGTGIQITPTITWASPAAITYGTPLTWRQLKARSTVAGIFSYSPEAGTVLGAGEQTLTVTFTPADIADYASATATVALTVNQATPAIFWFTPAAITYGTPLSGTQLIAKSTVPGTFTYSPAAGTVLNAGTQTLTATFAPTDAADYATQTESVKLTVNKANIRLTWATPAVISYGTALSATQLNATSTAAGTFSYSPADGATLGAGSHTLSVIFRPAIASNYTTASETAAVKLTVNKATPSIDWSAPNSITYGTALSGIQLIANSPVAGKFTYSPAAGTMLTAGSHTLSTTFVPTDTADYMAATASVTLAVNKAMPVLKLESSASTIAYGKSLTFKTTSIGSGVVPTGAVSFFDGATPLGTRMLNSSGVATYSTMKLAVGKHSITTSYSGDRNYVATTSAMISITVTAH